ncbi:major facilitator superfamily domain-containing protein [Boeremia exigua]|uniref:major facilitator superfamily domain-containing protein n=1 Tax=Boeremia exigua TaxID=749465 RepID=UPI001E8E3AE5|nr:major facilitator superfamily domain-containing protein [Boeremia exigua]KAH6615112.1 major facilitator superfamily domain-containing protein [Boeremia exigua]
METPTRRIVPADHADPDIELDATSLHPAHPRPAEHEFSLPPVDGGKDAWLFLLSAFVLEILVWGFPFSFGIFQEHYSAHAPFAGSRNIAIIGTCALGLMYLSSPLAGTGLGGVIIPLLLQYLLGRYGFRTALHVWAVVLFVAVLPLTVYLRPRLPVAQVTHHRRFDMAFLRNKSFLLIQLGNVLEGLGYFVPAIYLPTYARTLGASSAVSALTLILINVAAVFGCIIMGGIVDRWHITTCILLSTVGSTLSVFLLWGFSTNLSLLLVFCAAYGFFAGSYSTTYPGVMKTLRNSGQTTDSTMVYAALVAGRGIGNVVCGPVSEALIRMGQVGDSGAYASEYGPLVLFTGISAALGGVSCFGRTLGWF